MDGAVYHGDPSDHTLMRRNVAACERGIALIDAMRPSTVAQGPEKLFVAGRILERAATLSYIGLGDATTALREVTTANLYFRIAAGLPNQSQSFQEAASANARLTSIQLRTLHSELAAQLHAGKRVVTAYHRE